MMVYSLVEKVDLFFKKKSLEISLLMDSEVACFLAC